MVVGCLLLMWSWARAAPVGDSGVVASFVIEDGGCSSSGCRQQLLSQVLEWSWCSDLLRKAQLFAHMVAKLLCKVGLFMLTVLEPCVAA